VELESIFSWIQINFLIFLRPKVGSLRMWKTRSRTRPKGLINILKFLSFRTRGFFKILTKKLELGLKVFLKNKKPNNTG
jgi:hypothetical protein